HALAVALGRARGALEPRDLVGAPDLDPVPLADRAEVGAAPAPELAFERLGLLHHDRDALAELPQRRGDLGADVRAADADDPLGAVDVAADRVGVAERAEVVDALELGAVDGQAADDR